MIVMYCKIYKEAVRQRKALSRTSSNIVLNSVHHHRSSTRQHHHQQMLLQAAAETGEFALLHVLRFNAGGAASGLCFPVPRLGWKRLPVLTAESFIFRHSVVSLSDNHFCTLWIKGSL